MKKNNLKLSLLLLLAPYNFVQADCQSTFECASDCNSNCSESKNFFNARAFSSHSSRNLILEKSVFQTESERDEWNGTLSVAVDYMSNFGQKCGSCKNIGAMPFWSGTNELTIGNNDGKANLDAYQFGMGNVNVGEDGIAGVLQLNPRITQLGADFLLYFTQHKDKRGFYFKIDAPLGAMTIDPRAAQLATAEPDNAVFLTQTTTGQVETISFIGNFATPDARPQSIVTAWQGVEITEGNALTTLSGILSTSTTPLTPLPLTKGRISGCKQTDIRLADLSAVIGYNVYANEKSLIGVGFKASMATGSVPTGEYMLEPIFGRGGAWGVGAEVMAHHKAWENDAGTRYLDLWLQGEALHLVPGRTGYRSFDLKANGAGSKYMLIQKYQAVYGTVDDEGDITYTPNVYAAGAALQAVNVTTLPVVSKISVEGSVALMADFHCHNWNFGIGGEFWGRSNECLAIDECYALANLNDYAVLGRQLSQYDIQGSAVVTSTLCEPAAKINESQDPVVLVGALTPPLYALPTTLPAGIENAALSANRIPADFNEALDIGGAAASKAYTGKVFAQVGYNFAEHRYSPTVSLIGGAEFTNKSNNAVQMWSVALQGALNF